MVNTNPFPPTHGFIGPRDAVWLQQWTSELAVLFVFVGIHSTFYIISTHLLIKEGLRNSGSRMFLFVCTTAMFCISIAGAACTIQVLITGLGVTSIHRTAQSLARIHPILLGLRITTNVLLRTNFLISDTVVVWRTYVLFRENRVVRLCLVGCLCGTYFSVTANTVLTVVSILNQTTKENLPRSLLLTVPLLVTNLTATGLMGWKAWTHREYVCDSFLRRKHKSRAELALLLLVESGLAYCAVWVVVLVSGLGALPGDQRSTLLGALCSICGAYPTFIVIMVGLQRSSVDSVLAGDSALVPLTPGRWSGTSKGMSAGIKAKFSSREKVNVYGVDRDAEGHNANEQYTAFMMPMSPTRQSWPFAVPPTGPSPSRRQMPKRASSPPGAAEFGRLIRVPERSSSLVSSGASMVSPGPDSSMIAPSPASPMPYAAMSPSSTFSALDAMSEVPLMSSSHGGHSRQSSYGGHSRSSSDAPLLGSGNGLHSMSSSDAPLLGSYNDNRISMEDTSFIDMASSEGGHTSSNMVELPTPAPTSARPDFPEASARKRDTYRLSYPTMAWTDNHRASLKDTRKGFVRLSTVDEA